MEYKNTIAAEKKHPNREQNSSNKNKNANTREKLDFDLVSHYHPSFYLPFSVVLSFPSQEKEYLYFSCFISKVTVEKRDSDGRIDVSSLTTCHHTKKLKTVDGNNGRKKG